MGFSRDDVFEATDCPYCDGVDSFVYWRYATAVGTRMLRDFLDAADPIKALRYVAESVMASRKLRNEPNKSGAARVRSCKKCGRYGYRCPICRTCCKIAGYPSQVVPRFVCSHCDCTVFIEKP